MTYPQVLRYLNSFVNYEKESNYPYRKSFKLERMKGFLKLLNNPQEGLRCLHIAGSKGKGSTCAFIAYILREAGFKTGLYTSPHLVDFRERIRILQSPGHQGFTRSPVDDFEGMISKSKLTGLVEKLKPLIDKYNRASKYEDLTFFEVYTALAFIYFKEKKVDFAVLETGLGGRLDATNVVNALVSVLTPISYEHTDKLGKTLRQIAKEKAGIIKAGYGLPACRQAGRVTGYGKVRIPIVVTAPQEKEVMQVMRKKCKKVGAIITEVGKDIRYRKTGNGFSVKGIYGRYPDLRIRLIGSHQLINAVMAISAVRALQSYNIKVGIDCIRRGLYHTLWPARCEVLSRDPLVVLDGAQNAASARVFKEAVKENFNYGRLILVLGISNDKDTAGICGQLDELADEIILTKADNPRAAKPGCLAKYFKDKKTHIARTVKEALGLALKKANAQDLVLVSGSLFVAGEARKILVR